jgi:PKD repeat protein
MASGAYQRAIKFALTGTIDFDSDTFYAMLVTSAYTPDFDLHDFRNDITNEVVGTGYTAGGQAVVATVTQDTANDRIEIAFGDVTFSAVTVTARAHVIYKHRGGASSADEVVAYVDYGSNKSASGADFIAKTTSPLRFQF